MGIDPIRAYLDELRSLMHGNPLRRRRILREIEGHLDDAARAAQERGLPYKDAALRAIEEFGCPDELARRFRSVTGRSTRLLVGWLLASLAVSGGAFAALLLPGAGGNGTPRGLPVAAESAAGAPAQPELPAAQVPADVRLVGLEWGPGEHGFRDPAAVTDIVVTKRLTLRVSVTNVGNTTGRRIPIRLTLDQYGRHRSDQRDLEGAPMTLTRTIDSIPPGATRTISFGPGGPPTAPTARI